MKDKEYSPYSSDEIVSVRKVGDPKRRKLEKEKKRFLKEDSYLDAYDSETKEWLDQGDKLELISFKDGELFEKVILEGLLRARKSLIIGTYNLQDIRIKENHQTSSLSEILVRLLRRNVQILMAVAAFMQRSRFIQNLQMSTPQIDAFRNINIRFCRRMHFKTIIVDLKYAYIGTANLSGAGIGLKSLQKRNFELGFVTHDTGIIADLASTFMEVFNGKFCTSEGCHFFKNPHLEESCKGIIANQV